MLSYKNHHILQSPFKFAPIKHACGVTWARISKIIEYVSTCVLVALLCWKFETIPFQTIRIRKLHLHKRTTQLYKEENYQKFSWPREISESYGNRTTLTISCLAGVQCSSLPLNNLTLVSAKEWNQDSDIPLTDRHANPQNPSNL